MNKVKFTITSLAALAIMIAFIGITPAFARRAEPGSGTGCFVRIGEGPDDYAFDAACQAHDVLKLDHEGNLDFYVYQDHGQLPAGGWLPFQSYRSTFEQCFNMTGVGLVCGTAKESVSPSGEYKSSFKSY
jgi:hypothetical protein